MRIHLLPAAAVVAFAAVASPGAAQRADAPPAASDLSGTWLFAVVTENGTGVPTVVLRQQGDSLRGTYESRMFGLRQIVGTTRGDSVRFTVKATGEGGVDLHFVGRRVTRDSVAGEVDMSGMGTATFAGKRGAP
jgi:hypothetical protein